MQEAQAGGFWSYTAGTAYRLLVDFGVGGLFVDNYRWGRRQGEAGGQGSVTLFFGSCAAAPRMPCWRCIR